MLRIDLPFSDGALLLQPRFADSSVALQILAALTSLLPLLLIGWLYRTELRLVRPNVARGLLVLRLSVVGLIVVLIGFQPVLARTITDAVPGRVIVALDRSDSMGVADPQRPLAEKLKLVRALRLAADICDDKKLGDWIKDAEQFGQVNWPIGGATPDAERQQFDQIVRRAEELTRSQLARRLLAADGLNLLQTLGKRHRVDLVGFTGSVSELTPEQLATLQAAGESGLVTDLRAPLARALAPGADGASTLAVILLTDGQHNESVSPVKKAAELGGRRIPVYPIAIGSKAAPTDIIVMAVQAPTSVFKGSDVAAEVRVQVNGLSERVIPVELRRPGRPPLVERIRHDGIDRAYNVRFQTRMDEVGTQPLTVVASPAPEETRTENNSRTMSVNVADDKAKVLLIDGEARWEYHYLASALARDHGTETKSVVFAQPRTGRLSEGDVARLGYPARQLPSEADAFDSYDCIILGDVTPEQLPADDRQRLERYVGERGGTLIVLAGQRAMPVAFVGTDAADPLTKLLPITEPRALRSADGFSVIPTAEGKLTGYLQMESTPEDSERRWATLPSHYWAMIGKAKPGATVLATIGGVPELEPVPGASGPRREQALGLIVRHNYGFGRVIYVGLESTWRWRFKAGDTYHHRFWGQAIRWGASDKPLLVGNEFLRFGPRKPATPQGQEVELVARLSETARKLPPNALAAVRIFRQVPGKADEPVSLTALTHPESRPRELEAKVRDLPPGQYVAELAIPDLGEQLNGPPGADGRPGPLRVTFAVSPREMTEMSELAVNLPLLEELAAKSGGKVFMPETVAGLAELVTQRQATRTERVESKLWRSWPTLLLFLALLTLEWAGRKWAGLP
jgi:hypothetical protein